MSRKQFLLLALAIAATAGGLMAQRRDRDRDQQPVRSVEGTVRDEADAVLEGAVVQLKDIKTLQIRSFITKQDGTYHFHGLNPNVDYELRAQHSGASSDVKTLSIFDSRQKAVINLKIKK